MTKLQPSKRIDSVEEYYFSKKLREIADLKAKGADIINLGIGSPDLPPPDEVIAALSRHAAMPDNHQYQSYKGLPALREAFSSWYKKYYQVELDSEAEILPLIGSKEGIMHISMAFLNEGDEVLVPNPGYPTYASAAKLAGGVVRHYSLKESNDWAPDLTELAEQGVDHVKLMWINYPHMPTGSRLSGEQFRQLVDFAREHRIILINDNPYSFILNQQPESILNYASREDAVLELNSLSKSHNMAGWRLGMLGGNALLLQHVLTFKSNMDSGMFLPVQMAGVTALELGDDWYTSLNAIYADRRKFAWEFMDILNCTYDKEAVGMFVWAKIPSKAASGLEIADDLLYNFGLFITPGFIFGPGGESYVRVSLCTPESVWKLAINRILMKKEKLHT
jgi:aspartate/methionine/tyrosine aminotransferase